MNSRYAHVNFTCDHMNSTNNYESFTCDHMNSTYNHVNFICGHMRFWNMPCGIFLRGIFTHFFFASSFPNEFFLYRNLKDIDGNPYFHNFFESYYQLYIFTTTANSPDVG